MLWACSVAFEGLLYICRTVYGCTFVVCWSCALVHWNRTAEYISADEESADEVQLAPSCRPE